jgi:hypothetical protein
MSRIYLKAAGLNRFEWVAKPQDASRAAKQSMEATQKEFHSALVEQAPPKVGDAAAPSWIISAEGVLKMSKKVQKAIDPKQVLATAEVFRAGGAILSNHGPSYMFPIVICLAFSLELYFKCLILLEGGAALGHDLEDLFSKTSPESQKQIRASYAPYKAKADGMYAAVKGVPIPPTDFDAALRASARAFEHFRYAFEGAVKDQEGWMGNDICECVRDRIAELKPEWAK